MSSSDELTTHSTYVCDLASGDVVYHFTGDRVVLSATTDDRFGTLVVWKDGGRDSYPPSYKVYVVR